MTGRSAGKKMNIIDAIAVLDKQVPNPSTGLPDDLFFFISRMTPLINVDLLIKNEDNHTLLTWRDDGLLAPGWHIPGGIIRYKETIPSRIKALAACELGTVVEFKANPLSVNEVIHKAFKNRGHFISFLYECRLISPLDEKRRYLKGLPKPGEWAWHSKCPNNLISAHKMYRDFI